MADDRGDFNDYEDYAGVHFGDLATAGRGRVPGDPIAPVPICPGSWHNAEGYALDHPMEGLQGVVNDRRQHNPVRRDRPAGR